MARSSGAADRLPQADFRETFAGSHSRYNYTVSSHARTYTLTISKTGSTAAILKTPLNYFVGSGALARSYLMDIGGFLYEAPVALYSVPGKWGLAPGYENYSYPYLTRAVVPGCLECHATGVRWIRGTQNGYERPPFLEGGAGCERCHGRGADHVRTARREDIVNPARLDAERRDSVCEQCHLSGDVRVPRRPAGDEFQAGSRFADYAVSFSRQSSAARAAVTSHVENFASSRCKRASGDRMWCGSCHDPHFEPEAAGEKTAWFRTKCLACHAPSACTEKRSNRAAQSDNCIACHMPRHPVTDAAHVVYTDHSIPRRPGTGNAARAAPARDAPLIAFNETAPNARDLGLAYAILGAREQNPVYRDRAFDLLRTAERDYADDPQVISYLADLYRARSEDAKAIPLFEKLLKLDPSQSSAPAALGAYAMERGNYEEAIRLWREALRISPALLLVRANLAVALIRTGRRDEARAVLEKALQFNPEFPSARDLLKQLQ